MAVSFDLFGTLVTAERPADPAATVGRRLRERGVAVPDDWTAAYREPHVDAPPGAEIPLPDHVAAALHSRGVAAPPDAIREAVVAAFDVPVRTRDGAAGAVDAARECSPVGVLSNCSVPGLVRRTIGRSALDPGAFDAVVASVDCGRRKPDARAFEAVARDLGVPVEDLIHVGDDPRTDGGASAAGARAVLLSDTPLAAVPACLEGPA